jgi:adenylosuccinate lyase
MRFHDFAGVKAGGDRQDLHEAIRVHSMEAGAVVKGQGKPNDLLDRIKQDPKFAAVHSKLDQVMDPSLFVGRAPQQVDEFVAEEVEPMLKANQDLLSVANLDGVNV